jgi:undecaprenyl-diphosphatase
MPTFLQIVILAFVQGLAELLPVSSSAHVIVAEKLMGLDPSSPTMTLVLVMLHTGTMFAVIVYFWKRWVHTYFCSREAFQTIFVQLVLATILTGVDGYPIKKILEKTMFHGAAKAELEQLFSRLDLVAVALFFVGVLILTAGLLERRPMIRRLASEDGEEMSLSQASFMGIIQGLSLPFRGFSRSGSTISAGMLAGVTREHAETFSFALAVVLTPAVVGYEVMRLIKATHEVAATGGPLDLPGTFGLSLLGMGVAFVAGLIGLKWLSSWLESGKWYLFGIYCLVASVVVFNLHARGY